MSDYRYIDPVENGYKKVKFSKSEHKSLFPMRKLHFFTHYDYYIGTDSLILHRTTSLSWKVLITIGFPFVLFGYGVFNFKDVLREYYELYHEKHTGSFGSDQVWITIGFPFVLFGYGVFNFKDVLREYYELYHEKHTGSFGSDQVSSRSETYKAAATILSNRNQRG